MGRNDRRNRGKNELKASEETKTLVAERETENKLNDVPAPVITDDSIGNNVNDSEEIINEEHTEPIINEDDEGDVNISDVAKDITESDEESETTNDVLPEVINNAEAFKLLANPEYKIEEKLTIISEKGVPSLRSIIGKLRDYSKESVDPANTPDRLAKLNLDLFMSIKNALNVEDKTVFNLHFDIINLAFKAYANKGLDLVTLHRYDTIWPGTAKQKKAYLGLVTVIAMLADIVNRRENLKGIQIENVLNTAETGLKEEMINNIIEYYNK